MSARQIIFIVLAIVIVGATVFVTRDWLNNRETAVVVQQQEAPKQTGVEILVAKQDIPIGSFLQKTHMEWKHWPKESVVDGHLVKQQSSIDDLVGAVARKGLTAGQPIDRKRIVKPGDRGFLAAVLRPGYRAMAIRVNATSGISGLIFPGDRIDLILTHQLAAAVTGEAEFEIDEDGDKVLIKKEEGEEEEERGGSRVSETVLTNVRVLAIDQFINDVNGKPRVGKNATLEITPKQAEMLAVLTQLGSLSLALRSLAKDEEELQRLVNEEEPLKEPDPVIGGTFTFDNEVSHLIGRKGKVVNIVRGTRSQNQAVQ